MLCSSVAKAAAVIALALAAALPALAAQSTPATAAPATKVVVQYDMTWS
ncbi:hypothetical protein ACIA8O_27825 [Kitasatospora sp. NPDC051853]